MLLIYNYIGTTGFGRFGRIYWRVDKIISYMKIAVMELRLYAPWVHSLKEKRMVVKSLLGKIRSRYAVSAAETAEQDIHQTIVIGVAAIVAHAAQADSMMEDILAFVESSTEAEIVSVEREIR